MTVQAQTHDPAAIPLKDLERWIEVITPTEQDVALWHVLDRWLRFTRDTPRHKVLRFLVEPQISSPNKADSSTTSGAVLDLTDRRPEDIALPQCAA